MTGIYKITNTENQKMYIGQSRNIDQRWKTHKRMALKLKSKDNNSHLYNAMRKYGLEKFKFEVVEECSIKLLNDREKYWILEYNSVEEGYNQNCAPYYHHGSLLNRELIESIQNKLRDGIAPKIISEEMNIKVATIHSINTGKTWHHPDIEYPLYKKPEVQKDFYCSCCGCKLLSKGNMCLSCLIKLRRANK
jgi:group I intron endonuclease